MKNEIYKGYKIKSTPHELKNEGIYKYSVNGIIQVDLNDEAGEIPAEKLGIPDSEWKHYTESEADSTFIKYAKKCIDSK